VEGRRKGRTGQRMGGRREGGRKGGWKEREEGGEGRRRRRRAGNREQGEKEKDEKLGSRRYQVGTVYFLVKFKSSTMSQVHRVETEYNYIRISLCKTGSDTNSVHTLTTPIPSNAYIALPK